ncbi:stationary phase inducible protein CsiE [Klebsiella sp. 141240]|uniref:stationary phase inducible protein CsiE n=1 Tax=Klebsiella sp. 141240 TaxID=3020034 RepID=UPI002292C9B8|nr:stationary phase inducible protein CsiE [Klebsiella aerogenes]HCU2335489.1 stationary phase inducible protein CsiE [Klebsiella aerogenes]HDS7113954.1 stationary phase inducible protein CsiE [Klebsiella aerogenes]
MMTVIEPPSALSSPQRRSQVLLMFYLPGQSVTPQQLVRLNQVDEATAQQDIAETGREIQRYHRLTLASQMDGSYRIEGAALDQRLCLLHALRRGLRLCPHFVHHHFTPALKTQLKQQGIARTLYDDTNLQALVNRCARTLNRQFDCRDGQFLRLYLQYCLLQHHLGQSPDFTREQRNWAQAAAEFNLAAEIVRHWQRRVSATPHAGEQHFLTLLFMLLKTPDPIHDGHQQDRRLHLAISRLIHRFQDLAGRPFSDEQGLSDQLYIHLSQALNRSVFAIGIDNALPEEIGRLYPRLMRTTQEALRDFETAYHIQFNQEEVSLIAVIFGAWLMQKADLHEKQVVLLTRENSELEQALEMQLRELTLLPLNIKYLSVTQFQQQGAPKDVTLVVTPYTTALPLFSPPLFHAEENFSDHQRQQICKMLED